MAKYGSRKSQATVTAGRSSVAAKPKSSRRKPADGARPAGSREQVLKSGPSEAHGKRLVSDKAERFTESVIREMTRQAQLHGAMNLSQGFPDFPAPAELKRAAQEAIEADFNQYSVTWGMKPLRDAIAEKHRATQGVEVDPDREVTVCCGSTEAMMSSMLAIVNPGDEVIVFEPFYENYC